MTTGRAPISVFAGMACAGAVVLACIGADPTTGAGGSDAGSERPATGGGGACTALTATGPIFDCPRADGSKESCPTATKACCVGSGCVDTGAACPSGGAAYRCIATSSCATAGDVCCVSGTFDPTPACGLPSVLVPNATAAAECMDPALCTGPKVQLCATGSDCIAGECKKTTIVAQDVSFVVSTCQ